MHAARATSLEQFKTIYTKETINQADDTGLGLGPLQLLATMDLRYDTDEAFEYCVVELDADVNFQDANGRTPLHYVVANDRLMLFLLEHGANPNVVDKDGETPLSKALRWSDMGAGIKEHVLILIDYGAVGAPTDKWRNGNGALEFDPNDVIAHRTCVRSRTLFLLALGRVRNVPCCARQDINIYRLIGKQMWSTRLEK